MASGLSRSLDHDVLELLQAADPLLAVGISSWHTLASAPRGRAAARVSAYMYGTSLSLSPVTPWQDSDKVGAQ